MHFSSTAIKRACLASVPREYAHFAPLDLIGAHSRTGRERRESPFCAASFHAHQYEMLVRHSRSRLAPSTWTWWSVLAALVLLAGSAASESQQSTSSNAQSIAQA